MPNPAAVLLIEGRVHSVLNRDVPPSPARPEITDPETGRVTQWGRDELPGYTVVDVTLLTEHGGFLTVQLQPEAQEQLEGVTPSRGDDYRCLARPFVRWDGRPGNKRPVVGFSVAGDLTKTLHQGDKQAQPDQGKRSLQPTG